MAAVRTAIIEPALREIGVLAAGESASYHDANDALAALNLMLDQYAAERLQIPVTVRTVFPLTANVGEYAFGGAAAQPRRTVTDGFDGEWVPSDSANMSEASAVSVPPNWSMTETGASRASKDPTVFQAGSASLMLQSDLGGHCTLTRDFPVKAGEQSTFSIWLKGSVSNTARVRIQNVDTGNYLAGASGLVPATWGAASSDLFTSTDASLTRYWITFAVESLETIGERDSTLRVTLTETSAAAGAWFDSLTFEAEGPYTSIPIPRPVFISDVNLIDTASSPDLETTLDKYSDQQWPSVAQKSMTSARPTHWHYNPTYPNGTLSLWPIPTGSSLKAAIYVPTQVAQFADLDADVILPPAYGRMLVKNLALELCPAYGRQPSPLLVRQAAHATRVVKASNHREREMSFDAGQLVGHSGAFNFRTGR